MSDSAAHLTVVELVKSFADAPGDELDEIYGPFQRLADALWDCGTATWLAPTGAAELVAAFGDLDERRQGYAAVLLGLLAEADDTGEVIDELGARLGGFLLVLGRGRAGEPLTLALLYLLAHLPEERERVLGAAAALDLAPDELTRLDRCLQRLPLDPEDVVLGRAWPSPWDWSLSQAEREFDKKWIRGLSPEEITDIWDRDTRTVLGYAGAKAYWAVRHASSPVQVADTTDFRDVATSDAGAPGAGIFARLATALRCPVCRGVVRIADEGVRCEPCGRDYAATSGILDLTGGDDNGGDAFQSATALPGVGSYYEARLRPAFLRAIGANWDGAVTPAVEDDYIATRLRPVDGPVLDLAAGAGRWTAVVAETVGAERVVALDLNASMLLDMRQRLAEVPAVLASALDLPFADGSLGGVNCWNALQAMPDAAQAIAEVGRCLRPGGVFTLLTFRPAPDPVYRYFQNAHSFPGNRDGLPLFEFAELRAWLAAAGMTVVHESGPGTFAILTARRDG